MPLPAAPDTASRPADILIPDCCNIGVVFRSLIGVNVAAFAGIMAQARDWAAGTFEFVEASMVIELSCLWSLFALCGLRQLLLRSILPGHLPGWPQRAASILVPVAVTGAVIHLFTLSSGLAGSFGEFSAEKGMVLAGLFGAFFQHYFELRKRAFSPAIVEARLQALQARIRPHFLFNSLNAALSLIRTEPRRAENTLEDLADLFRVLMSDPRSMTSLHNEIRLCQQYLSIEKIRMGDRMDVLWEMGDIDGEVLRRAQVPVLLLQPLIENAVHYGVEPTVEPAQIKVTVARFMDKIEIVVTNPYHGGASVEAGNRMALENIRERLALLFDVEALLVTAANGNVFEARLRFPYVKGVA
ncbi:sensor histidine kinase [Noviherbaspirillum sp. ST9]|uniref:sensor histidine kinase n=1 Tax=Noviherbaspirillum sp. ST9 TaxID=3401606 RepID=UPI003B58A188